MAERHLATTPSQEPSPPVDGAEGADDGAAGALDGAAEDQSPPPLEGLP